MSPRTGSRDEASYYPEAKDRSSLGTSVQPRAVAQGVNLKPVAAPDTLAFGGSRYFFISARSGFTNIYSATYRGSERNVKSVVRGQRGSQFESFHPFESRIDVSRRNELAFVSKWNGRDALFIMDSQKGDIRLRRHVDGLISLASPAWSHDGSRIAFSGISPSGRSDLYVMSRDTGDVKRLTNDDYADLDPTWSPDDKTIAFASDRTRYGKEGHHNLFLLDVQSLEIRYLTYGPWMDQSDRGRMAPGSRSRRIAAASSRSTPWIRSATARVSHLLSTTLDPAWLPDGKGSLLFTGFNRGEGFGIYQLPLAASAATDSFHLDAQLAQGPPQWNWTNRWSNRRQQLSALSSCMGLDLVQGGISVAPTDNMVGGFQGAFSDILGNRVYFVQVSNNAQQLSQLLTRMNLGVWSINGSTGGTTAWACSIRPGITSTSRAWTTSSAGPVDFSDRELSLLAVPPHRRLDVDLLRSEGPAFRLRSRGNSLATHSISFVSDNTLWYQTGPLDGSSN